MAFTKEMYIFLTLFFLTYRCGGLSVPSLKRMHHSVKDLRNSQMEQDISMEKWYRDQRIVTSDVILCTSDKSVGGRGIFSVSNKTAGDILAYIPSKCLIAPSILRKVFPQLKEMEEIDAGISWPAKLTMYAQYCNQSSTVHREWIGSWQSSGLCTPHSSYSLEELKDIADITGSSMDLVEDVIHIRYDTFIKDFTDVREFNRQITVEDFGNLYSMVLSRTAVLGPEWQRGKGKIGYERPTDECGIIPVHDMINHPPWKKESNIELFCFGDMRKTIGFVSANKMLKDLFDNQRQCKSSLDQVCSVPYSFDDKDILLVASRNIDPGQELLIRYKSNKRGSMMGEKERLWFMFQYGFPLHV